MDAYHIVEQGEHLAGIARAYGFLDYRTLWNHPNNLDLKLKRKNPGVLFPGDKVFVPNRELRNFSGSTNVTHSFQLKGTPIKLRLVLEDSSKKPIANTPCVLTVRDVRSKEETDGHGQIESVLDPLARDGVLVIQDSSSAFDGLEILIRIGNLDPLEEVSGQRARLDNLGYSPGESDRADDQEFRSAVEEFQCDHGLVVDGVCGLKTQATLKKIHGC